MSETAKAKWLKDEENNIVTPKTLSSCVFEEDGTSVKDKFSSLSGTYALISESGYDLGLSIDTSTYVMTIELKNKLGTVLSTKTIDFPIESMVVNASYANGILTLTLQSGQTLDVDISAIISGLVNDSFTIAGIDMKDDITASELKIALGLTKSDVGLNNVDNTSDLNKPISTATQSALDNKTDKSDFDKLEDDIYDSTLIRDISLDTAEQGFVQWGRSSITANAKYYHSEKIKMLKNDIIKVKAKGYITSSFAGVTIIAIASSTGWYEGVVNSADSTLRDYEWKATEDCDVIVCFEYSQVDNTTIRVIKATNFEDYIREEVSVFEDTQIKERATRDEKANDFVWKTFDKAYFAFVIDDANEYLYPMYQTFHANNVPLGSAVTIENLSKEVSGIGTRKDVVDLIIADGGECLSHYSGNLYSIGAEVPKDGRIYLNTKKDWDEKIRDVKKDLISMGLNPRGVILADYSELRGKTGEEYCRAYYEYSDGMGSSTQYNLRRKFVSSFATIDAFKEWIDSKAGTKGFYPICLHGSEAVASTENMDTIIKYILAKGNGVAITTYANVIDTFGSHSLNEGKVDKVPGKGLSTNDYTSAEKAKLASLENYNDAEIKSEISQLNNDLSYKEGVKLVPADFETVLGYYSENTFHEGQKSWMCRLLRVSVNEGEKYKYYTYTDNIYVINYLDSDLNVVKQDTATKNVELEIDVVVPSGVSYIDFYTASFYYKSYVLKYDTSESLYKEEGHIYIDATSDFTVTDGKFFIPNRTSYVDGYKMILKSVTTSKDTLYRFSFAQHQVYSAYVDDCCIAPHITYVDGTEVFRENIVVYVPQGKTLRINDYDSSTYTSKIEKLVGLTEQVILELISRMM